MFNVYFNIFLQLNCYVFLSYSNVYIFKNFNSLLLVYIFYISVSEGALAELFLAWEDD